MRHSLKKISSLFFVQKFFQRQKVPLRWVLVIPFLLQTTVAVGITGYLTVRNGQRAVNQLAEQLRQEMSARVEQHLDALLILPHQLNRQVLDGLRSGAIAPTAFRNNGRHFALQVQRQPDISFWGYYLQTGQGVGAGRWLTGQGVTISEHPQPNQTEYAYATDADGNPTQLLQTYPSYDPRQEVWYREVVQSRKPTWTRVFISDIQGYVSASAGAPIYDADGQLLGVVTADILLTRISDFLQSLKISERGQVFILERNGLLIGQSNSQPTIQIVDGKNQRVSLSTSPDPILRATATELEQRFGGLQKIQAPQSLDFVVNHTRQFARVSPWRDAYGLDWLVVVVVPETDFMAQIHANTRSTIFWCTLVFLAALGSGWWAAHWITEPIFHLSRASRFLANSFQSGIFHKTSDRLDPEQIVVEELSVMAGSFNQMAEQLQVAFGRVQTALQESEDRFTKIFQYSPDSIVIVTRSELRFLEVNDSFCRLTGYALEELIGQTCLELQLWVDPSIPHRMLEAIAVAGRKPQLEAELRQKSGGLKTVLMSAEWINLEGQECILAIAKDISDRKQEEIEMLRALAREKELNELRARFVSTVSHEFRTPLTTIQSSAELLEHYEWSPESKQERFEQIRSSIKHMTQLLEDTLLVGRLEAGNVPFIATPLDLRVLCQEAIADLALNQKNHKIDYQIHGEAYLVYLDPTLTRQILNNLLSNAIKYSPRGGAVQLGLTYSSDHISLTVQDEGIGIPPEELNNLFQPFYRARNVETIQGTGLGLSIVKRCVELQHGTIEVASQPGMGTLFALTFPTVHQPRPVRMG